MRRSIPALLLGITLLLGIALLLRIALLLSICALLSVAALLGVLVVATLLRLSEASCPLLFFDREDFTLRIVLVYADLRAGKERTLIVGPKPLPLDAYYSLAQRHYCSEPSWPPSLRRAAPTPEPPDARAREEHEVQGRASAARTCTERAGFCEYF